ncbi:hypothetical protein Q4S25_12595, partial [Morganella morganii]
PENMEWDNSADFNKHFGSGLEFDWIDIEETFAIPDRQGAMQVTENWDNAGWDDIERMSIVSVDESDSDSFISDTDSFISDIDSFISDTDSVISGRSSRIYETFNIAEGWEDENALLLPGSNNRITPAISSLVLSATIFGLLWWYQSQHSYRR